MKFERLQRRVARVERLVEGRALDTQGHWQRLRGAWRDAWTPGRILIVGLGLGFVTGRSEPKVALAGLAGKVGALPKLLQLASTLSALFTASQAQDASEQAERAADSAEDVAAAQQAGQPAAATPQPPVDGRSASGPAPRQAASAAPASARAPAPAEAATDVSEH